MALSEAQKHLIDGLKIIGVEKDAIPGIVSILNAPQRLDAMMEWMCEHKEANLSEILKQTAEIVKTIE